MLELTGIKDKFDNIFYVIYFNEKYNELFIIPKYIKINDTYIKIKDINEILKIVDYPLLKKSKFLKRDALIFPFEEIKLVYNPIAKLKRILKEPRDESEKRVKEFVELLAEESGESTASFGIGGSILLGLHRPDSDMDIAYYGKEPFKVYFALKKLREKKELDALPEEYMLKLYKEREAEEIMDYKTFELLEQRKLIEGKFKDKIYSIKFVNRKEYEPSLVLGDFETNVIIEDDSQNFLFPSIYQVKDISGKRFDVISFKLRYAEMLKKGEHALIRGQLEKDKQGNMRVVIQSNKDYIKPLLYS